MGRMPTTVPWSCLAFAERRVFWRHPFQDFNGRLTRAFLAEVLPQRSISACRGPDARGRPRHRTLSQALKAADRSDWGPLVTVWRGRFEKEADA